MKPRDTASTAAGAPRLVAVDMLKGCAALWVLLIHAEVLSGRVVMTHVFNRAAQLFVILIGLNASLWWRARGRAHVRVWYANRFRRLYPPMWVAVACWWALALALQPRLRVALSERLFAAHVAGYLDGIGTGWFVTYAIASAALLPLLIWSDRRIGRTALLAAGIASTLLSFFLLRNAVIEAFGLFGWLVFPPRLFAHLAFGIFLAPIAGRLGRREATGSSAILLAYFAVPWLTDGSAIWTTDGSGALAQSNLSAALYVLTDLPVCLLLLILLDRLRGTAALTRLLVGLGNESYAIYLGQMVVHNALGFAFGFHRLRDAIGAWGYAALLLAGALGWVAATRAVRARSVRLTSRASAAR